MINIIENSNIEIPSYGFRNFNCFILKIILLSIIFTSCEYLENDSKSKSYNSSRLITETVLCLKLAEEKKHIDTLFSTNKIKSLTNHNILIIKNKKINKEINLLKIKNNVLYIKEITNLNNDSFNTAARFYFNKNGNLVCIEREKYYFLNKGNLSKVEINKPSGTLTLNSYIAVTGPKLDYITRALVPVTSTICSFNTAVPYTISGKDSLNEVVFEGNYSTFSISNPLINKVAVDASIRCEIGTYQFTYLYTPFSHNTLYL